MTETHDEERTTLRVERDRLAMERAELQAEVARLEASRDADALRALTERLNRHAEALHAFHDTLGGAASNPQAEAEAEGARSRMSSRVRSQ